MIKINECVLDSVQKTPHKHLKLVFFIKPGDFDDELETKLFSISKKAGDGASLAGVFKEFTQEVTQEKKENPLQTLNFRMDLYCEKANIDIEKEKNKIYNEYNVTSRRELSPETVKKLIGTYEAGLLELN